MLKKFFNNILLLIFLNVSCKVFANPCLSNPCNNGGMCVVNGNAFECKCKPDFYGTCCEYYNPAPLPPNPCLNNPCKNGGICHSFGANFVCDCPKWYTGQFCQDYNPPNPCLSNPCKNGGTCFNHGLNFLCQCPAWYSGSCCEEYKPPNPCLSNPCKNGGTCQNQGGSFVCHCPQYFNGTCCQNEFKPPDPCINNPCKNGGRCKSQGADFICECPKNYEGLLCDCYNACLSNPCFNGGRCEAKGHSYTCTCTDLYTGKNCQHSGGIIAGIVLGSFLALLLLCLLLFLIFYCCCCYRGGCCCFRRRRSSSSSSSSGSIHKSNSTKVFKNKATYVNEFVENSCGFDDTNQTPNYVINTISKASCSNMSNENIINQRPETPKTWRILSNQSDEKCGDTFVYNVHNSNQTIEINHKQADLCDANIYAIDHPPPSYITTNEEVITHTYDDKLCNKEETYLHQDFHDNYSKYRDNAVVYNSHPQAIEIHHERKLIDRCDPNIYSIRQPSRYLTANETYCNDLLFSNTNEHKSNAYESYEESKYVTSNRKFADNLNQHCAINPNYEYEFQTIDNSKEIPIKRQTNNNSSLSKYDMIFHQL